MNKAAVALVAAAASVALAAGMTSPATANTEPGPSAAGKGTRAQGTTHVITLITGDRVVIDAKGRVAGVERAKGRENIPVQIRQSEGHTLVIPVDAARLIAGGKLDRRLFDITELSKPAMRKSQSKGLKVIVGYKGTAASVKAEVRDSGTLRHALKALNADAVQTSAKETPDLWDAITDESGKSAAAGIAHVWLDGLRKASLDKSVPQIGAPTAWSSGYTGKGVKVAVLDTGVDTTHADLKSQVAASKNFTTAKDATDHFGHGTHVASTVAGTGAKSGGKYKGVAPDAKILNGKVLDDDGYGEDSGILAGMEWAVQQGADVINMSLGGPDGPEIDPLEAEVNKLSAESGVLFAIAAGNSGPESIGSPGSADAALTVGAVDKKDVLADFSSTGPRVGDGSVKPDVTAPGVAITAASAKNSVIAKEVGESPAGYVTLDGTSMATPHVAGAAALLKQQHPDWKYTELKGALTGSAKGNNAYSAFEQGAGRIAVDKALTQTVVADPVSVSFGVHQWPHTNDKPVTKQVTYRNLGDTDVTLNLSTTTLDPKGKAAPAGFFTLESNTVTVPAHGTASVGLTVDTSLGGTLTGNYSAYVTAAGDGQTVRTAAAVVREEESYDVTLKFVNRDSKKTTHLTDILGYKGAGAGKWTSSQSDAGSVTVRLPKGTYTVDDLSLTDLVNAKGGADWLVQPKLEVTKNTTVTLDARTAKSADITVPESKAKPLSATVEYNYDPALVGFGVNLGSFKNLRVGHVGGEVSGLQQSWYGQWSNGGKTEYDTFSAAKVKKLTGAKVKHYKKSEFATVKVNEGAPASGKSGWIYPSVETPLGFGGGAGVEQKLPSTRTLYLSTGEKAKWSFAFAQSHGKDKQGYPNLQAIYSNENPLTFAAGKSYTQNFNKGVFSPKLSGNWGIYRSDNEIFGVLPLFADGAGNPGSSLYTSVSTSLYRNGTKVATNQDPLEGSDYFTVPSAEASYKLTTSVKRDAKLSGVSTRIDGTWTFKSKKADWAKLPASTLRYGIGTDSASKVAANKKVTYPVTVQGAAAGKNLKSLAVYVSYDGGKTWKKTTVTKGKITVKNPAKNKSVSLRANITDKKGNTSSVTIYNAYTGK